MTTLPDVHEAELQKKELEKLMSMCLEKARAIPHDQIDALQVVEMLLKVINTYASWLEAMKGEILKMDKTIQTQNRTLKSKFRDKQIITGM